MVKCPAIEYRVHTEEERASFWDYARNLPAEQRGAFWKQTVDTAFQRAKLLNEHGYVLTDAREHGSEIDGLGAHELVLPSWTKTSLHNAESDEIARLFLWEEGGFSAEPLQLTFDHTKGMKHINAVLELRTFLSAQGIPFWQSDRRELMIRAHELQVEHANLRYLLDNLHQ